MNYLDEIKKYEMDVVKDLIGLISIPSVLEKYNPKCIDEPFGKEIKEALVYMENLAKRDNMQYKNIDNYAMHLEIGEGEELIGVLGHLDVVPATGEWDNYPFKGTISNKRIYGRGASDDKGPTIAAYYALKMLKDNNVKLNKRVRLILGCDEESGSRCMKRYLEKEEMPSFGFAPDASFPVINGEKGIVSYNIIGQSGKSELISLKAGDRYNIVPDYVEARLNVNLEMEFNKYLHDKGIIGGIKDDIYYIKGKASHAMCPEKGINAIVLMCEFLFMYISDEVVDFVLANLAHNEFGEKIGINYYDKEMKDLTMNFAKIYYENGVVLMGLNFRIPDIKCLKIIEDGFKKVIGNFEFIRLNTPHVHFIPKDDKDVSILLDAYREYTNDYSEPITIGGGTYAQSFKKAVAFGASFPGKPETEHMPNEYMEIKDILLASAIYASAIERLCK